MVQASVEAIKALREQTSAGIMDCKRALEETGGDVAQAAELPASEGSNPCRQEGRSGDSRGVC